jgi:hypothetical protein
VKTPGEYALLQANGTPFAEIVQMIRDEQAGYLRTQGTEKDYEILDVSGIDGGESYMDWRVTTVVEEASHGEGS